MNKGRVVSVNVGQPREVEWLGKKSVSAIWKCPVEGRVRLEGLNLAGDDQADRLAHGGPDKAVYSYSREDEEWWEKQLARSLDPGAFGENLTISDLDVSGAVVGEQWEIGSALLEVCQPRIPCWKLGMRMSDPDFPPVFADAGRPGAYLRILREGEIGAGDEVRVVHRPDHGITVAEVARIYNSDPASAQVLVQAPQLAERMRKWAEKAISYAGRRARVQG